MNQDNIRGNAYGFQVELLPSLKLLRGNAPDCTLLSFLVGLITKEFPEIEAIVPELGIPISLARVNQYTEMQEHIKKFNEFSDAVQSLETEYQAARQLHAQVDEVNLTSFKAALDPFLQSVNEHNSAINSKFLKLQEDRTTLFKYFAETSTDITTEGFLGHFGDFLTDFETVRLARQQQAATAASQVKLSRRGSLISNEKRSGNSLTAYINSGQVDERSCIDGFMGRLRTGSSPLNSIISNELSIA